MIYVCRKKTLITLEEIISIINIGKITVTYEYTVLIDKDKVGAPRSPDIIID